MRPRRWVAMGAMVVLTTLATGGCHTMRFQVARDQAAGPPITESRMHRWWGLGTIRTVDVRARCPQGAVAVVERASAGDVLTGFLTFGFIVPRTMSFYCRQGAIS